jgi:hypothetical protein
MTVTPNSPFDSYGNLCWQDEQARLDNFSIQLLNDPNLIGYIVVYAGRISCRDEAGYRGSRARSWVLSRKVDPKRVIFKDGGYRREMQTVLHLQPKDEPDYQPQPTLKRDKVSVKRCIDKVFELKLCLNRE